MSEEMEYKRYVLGTSKRFRPNYQNGITYDTFDQAKDAAERFAKNEDKTMYIFERMEVTSLIGEVRADSCHKCKFYRELKHNFKQNIGYEISHACLLFADENDAYVVQVSPDDMCEMFVERIKHE